MADIHLADFYKDSARALVKLFASFPRPVMLCVEDFIGEDAPDEFGVHSQRHQACFATLLWLADSGYIRYVDTIRQEALDQATLSRSGFLLLAGRHRLSEDEEPPSAGVEHLRHALRSGSSRAIEQAMFALLSKA